MNILTSLSIVMVAISATTAGDNCHISHRTLSGSWYDMFYTDTFDECKEECSKEPGYVNAIYCSIQ